MYPAGELIRLAVHRAALQHTISRQRQQCAASARQARQPLDQLDQMLALWRRLSPLARLAGQTLGRLRHRSTAPRPLDLLLRWSLLGFAVLRRFRAAPPG